MTSKRSPFLTYRYLVTPISSQLTFQQQVGKRKEILFEEVAQSIIDRKKVEWTKAGKRYLFYGSQQKHNIFILKVARETSDNIYVEGDSDIEIHGIKEAKYILVIVDTDTQVVLLERDRNVFKDDRTALNIIQDFLRDKMKEHDYVVNIYPLVSERKFWNYVETADEIFELSLVMNAPNMAFFGHQDTRDLLRIIKEETNNEEFDIGFKNKEGKLKIMRDSLGAWVDYIREVGGRYKLKFSRNGVKETKPSESDIAIAYIDTKANGKFSDEELDTIDSNIQSISYLDGRNEANNF